MHFRGTGTRDRQATYIQDNRFNAIIIFRFTNHPDKIMHFNLAWLIGTIGFLKRLLKWIDIFCLLNENTIGVQNKRRPIGNFHRRIFTASNAINSG